MEHYPPRFRAFLIATCVAGLVVSIVVVVAFPPPITPAWMLAFGTLLALAVVSDLLALQISETGASTDASFVPVLASIILLGPTGAVTIVVATSLLSEVVIRRKSGLRGAFNMAQLALTTGIAGVVYVLSGGGGGLDEFSIRESMAPFALAMAGYFILNSVIVSNAVALRDQRPLYEVWQSQAGSIVLFDFAMSSLAFIVAILYTRWGAYAVLSALVPLIGLRYSYGVNLELQELNQDLLRVLIKTLEARDKYTSGHSVRVSERSRRIALQLGLRPRQVRLIETGALLHDIGKIDLAYGEILRQAGPLTPEQRDLIRAHPDKGVEIVSSVRSLDPHVLECIRHHHEWFDGTGYPTGIAGEDIPIGARIVMISDSVDAMMTDRPYRKALSVDEVRKELLRNSGSQFDPIVVDATLAAGVLEDPTLAVPEQAPAGS